MAGVQRQMDEWGRHDAIVWLCHSSDIAPKDQLWWVMYQCISCCPRNRQVWEEIPEETIYWQITELAHADLCSLLIILEWCEMLCLTSYLHWKKRCWKAKTGKVLIHPLWGIWIKALSRTRWWMVTKPSGLNPAVTFQANGVTFGPDCSPLSSIISSKLGNTLI